jgi:hypothetical protein
MNTWYTKALGDGITASMPSEEIREAFLRSFQASGQPRDMAIFTRLESEGRLYCEVIAYFSPSAREIARAFDAEPCEKPMQSGLDLLAGDPRCWDVLFPSG